MTKPLVSKLSGRAGRRIALATTALPMLLLMSPLAFAAAPASPAAGSLPGAFTTNTGTTTTYTGTGSTATISVGAGAPGGQVIQFGGSALANAVSPTTGTTPTALASATNPGFSVGSGATLNITGGSAFPTLINDESGNPSEVYGAVNAASMVGPLFVANANGIIVGSHGSIAAPRLGLGLVGDSQSSSEFIATGGINVNSSTIGTGDVSLNNGSTITNPAALTQPLLIASNGAINIGATISGASVLADNAVDVYAGVRLTTTAGAAPFPAGTSPLSTATSSSVTFSGGATGKPILVAALSAAGSVTNSGITDFTDAGLPAASPTIMGAFSNTGVATIPASFTAGSITNNGEIKAAGTTVALSTTGSGNFTNTGVIAFVPDAGSNTLSVTAANIDFGGTIEQTEIGATSPTALSAANYLTNGASTHPVGLFLNATSGPTGSPVPGVVDIATTVYAPFSVAGQAVRVMSGGLIDPTGGGADTINVGTGTATDPFFSNAKLAYNLSLFGGTTVASGNLTTSGTVTIEGTSSSKTVSPNININGMLGSATTGTIDLGAASTTGGGVTTYHALGNINGDSTGGLSVGPTGTVNADFTGNMNNPYGMAQAGQTSYLYNSLPITVANTTAGAAGTVVLNFTGPSSSSGTAQNVNLMVLGNATLGDRSATTTLPTATTPISPVAAYTNNHLIVQSTGNIQVGNVSGGGDGGSPATFYWPGLVYLSNASSASDPTALSASGSITLGSTVSGSSFATNLKNVVPAISTGGTGIFLETNNLALNGGTVTTSNNSWVNFANASLASAFKLTQSPQAPSFLGAYVDNVTSTVTELGVKALPTSAFQPAS